MLRKSGKFKLFGFVFFLAGFLTLWFLINYEQLRAYYQSYQKRQKALTEVETLQQRYEQLNAQQELLRANPELQEKVLRERFRYSREGEHLVLITRE